MTKIAFVINFAIALIFSMNIVNADEVSTAASSNSSCPSRLDGFENGVATAEQVKICIGAPHHEDHNPDGRFVYLYHLKNGIIITYLFDKSGILERTNAYKKN
jgi:hypothetical protein